MKKLVFLVLSMVMLMQVVVYASFTDVQSGHWAETYINELTEKGVINGMGDGTYAPDGTLTKGQFLKLIMTASLPDVDFSMLTQEGAHWANGYLEVAKNYAVIEEGEITLENIDQPISRLEVVKILSLCDVSIRENEQKTLNFLQFNDIENLDAASQAYLAHAVASGLINGYPDGSFKPENTLTRAEVAKIISVYMSL